MTRTNELRFVKKLSLVQSWIEQAPTDLHNELGPEIPHLFFNAYSDGLSEPKNTLISLVSQVVNTFSCVAPDRSGHRSATHVK